MITKQEIEKIGEVIERYQRFVLTTHVNSDGDGIGSEVALAAYLKQRKKEVKILNSNRTPFNLRFLDPADEIEMFDVARHVEYVTSADVLFILDISDWKRLRELGELVRPMGITKVCIDHHLCDKPFSDLDAIHSDASSTGEVMFDLLKGLGAKMNMRICEAIYTAILTDTGSFRFTNTSAKVHQIAAELHENKVDAHRIYQEIYENESVARIRLLSRVLGSMGTYYEGQLATLFVSQKMLAETDSTLKDIEGFSDIPRTISGVEVAILFVEQPGGAVKISFRSKGKISINALARQYDGGGHAFASGATIKGRLDTVKNNVVRDAASLFSAEEPNIMETIRK